jgi:hypothetical protein
MLKNADFYLMKRLKLCRMVSIGVYTPRTARYKIEAIDQQMKPIAYETETARSPQMLSWSPSESDSRHQTQSPSQNHHSMSWDIEDPERLLDDNEEEIFDSPTIASRILP